MGTLQDSDRAEIEISFEISKGEYNGELCARATSAGLELDEVVTIPWDWILKARQLLRLPPALDESLLAVPLPEPTLPVHRKQGDAP